MTSISQEIVESVTTSVGEMAPRAARRAMERAASQQPALLAYVVAATQDERAPVHELAIYLYFVLLQIFEAGAGSAIPEIGMEAVESRAEANEDALERLEAAHEGFVERAAEVATARQPFVLRYVVDALFAPREDDPDGVLEEEEAGFVFLILKPVLDLLDEATAAER